MRDDRHRELKIEDRESTNDNHSFLKPTGRVPWVPSPCVRFPKATMTLLRAMTSRFIPLFTTALLALAGLAPVYSGDAVAESEQRLLTDIKYLASDELEGRGVGLK